jgi:Fe2+ transport system protein FeoA
VTGVSTGPGSYIMQAMPAGTVTFRVAADGRIQARVSMFGFTPGSSHRVSADSPGGPPVQFPVLTANPFGTASAALVPGGDTTSLPAQSRLIIRLGSVSGDPLADEPIAESPVLPARLRPGTTFHLRAVTITADGASFGRPSGYARVSYDPAGHAVAVTLTASGLTPGPHAAHLHLGSCQDQGPVKYMLADFTADAAGNITGQTRVVTGVTSAPGAWYLNLHQGGGDQILSNGAPTLYFRPVLCTDVTSVALSGGVPANPAASQPTSPAARTTPPSASTPATSPPVAPAAGGNGSGATPIASMPSTPSVFPSYAGPTHW